MTFDILLAFLRADYVPGSITYEIWKYGSRLWGGLDMDIEGSSEQKRMA